MYTPVHTHTHTHTHTERACTTCSDIGSYFSQKVTHTNTHTHTTHACTHRLVPLAVTSIGFSFSHCFHKVYMCMNVHTCACTHIVCTQPVHHIFVTHTAHTHSTLALLRKWNLVHNTYIHSCTVHLYACILMNNIKHVYTHSHTHMYIARKVYSKLVLVTPTRIHCKDAIT